MQKLPIILIIAFSVCFANKSQDADMDIIKGNLDYLAEKYTELKNSTDSLKGKFVSDKFISVEAFKEAQELYNKSFSSMQTFFNIFIAALSALVLVFGWFNSKTTSDLKKEAKEELEKTEQKLERIEREFREKIEGLSDKSKKHDENIKTQQELMKEIKTQNKEYRQKMDELLININAQDKKKKALDVIEDPNASPCDKALAEAVRYYKDDKYERALKSYEDILKNYGDEITLTRLSQIYFNMTYSYTKIKPKDEKEKEKLDDKAMEKYKEVLKFNPKHAKASYNIACFYAKRHGSTGDPQDESKSFEYLKESMENKENYKELSFDYLEQDSDLKSLNKNDPRYKELKDKYG